MISDRMKLFIEKVNLAFVASSDQEGRPHLAAGQELKVTSPEHLVFEAWFCRKTLSNIEHNPNVAIVILDQKSKSGYQLGGYVEQTRKVAILNGFAPELEEPGMPQVQSRMVVRIQQIMEFSPAAHTDKPLSTEA